MGWILEHCAELRLRALYGLGLEAETAQVLERGPAKIAAVARELDASFSANAVAQKGGNQNRGWSKVESRESVGADWRAYCMKASLRLMIEAHPRSSWRRGATVRCPPPYRPVRARTRT